MKRLLCILFTIFLLAGCAKNPAAPQTIELYFLNSNSTKMVLEERAVEKTSSTEELLLVTANALISGPSGADLKAVIHPDTQIIDITLSKNTVTVNMSKEFDLGSDIEKLWSRYTLINTLCSIEGVNKTKILVEGQEIVSISTGKALDALGKEDIIIDAPPAENNYKTITLYFADETATYLKPETRTLALKSNETEEYIVVSEIINGPANDKLFKTVSSDVKIRSVETREGVCFVNLSQDFVAKNTGGSAKESFAIFSIVNSLCRLESVDKVQFLIEGQKVEALGQWVFSEPFTEDKSFYAQ